MIGDFQEKLVSVKPKKLNASYRIYQVSQICLANLQAETE